MPSEDAVLRQEGYWLNDAGHMVMTTFVDFRDLPDRTPITELVKLCEQQFAPETLGTVRVSKPEMFRDDGETLISDPEEARVSRVTSYSERINDPGDLAEAEVRSNESNRAAELAGSAMRHKTTGTKQTKKNTTTRTFGKNCWIFCTAIAPGDEETETELWEAMEPKYDHSTDIYQPRAFAFALSSMVAEELGPRGGEVTRKGRFGEFSSSSRHNSQTVFHGPVLYVDDPFEVVEGARNELEAILMPIFVKRKKYAAQREYRYVIWCDEQPTEPVVVLKVSSAMFSSFQVSLPEVRMAENLSSAANERRDTEQHKRVPGMQADNAEERPGPPVIFPEEPDGLPSVFDLMSDPATPVGIFKGDSGDVPLEEAELKHQVVRALRIAVERVSDDRLVEAASSAFHSEPLLIQLCEELVDPIRSVVISNDNFVIITVNTADWRSKAKIVVGPHGEVAHHLKREGFQSGGFDVVRHEFPLSGSMVEELSKLGLPRRTS